MSTVYRAFDTVLERCVAIKLMHRPLAQDSDQLERFRREARAVAQLNHPHIVGVIDAGEESDPAHPAPFIVFEFVEGETLKERIRRNGRLPVPEALAYAIEIARALGAAHAQGIVHRDVKPQNVLVDEEGTAKVTDFGIARTLDQEGLTADGRVLGTTDYVSPEQALGHAVTGQSDLYSLGIVLFEMLTGDVPFRGENQVAVAMKHVRDELPDLQLRRPEVSSATAAVVDRATAKDLDRRYTDDAELIADLEDVLAIETSRSGQATGEATAILRTLPARSRRRLPLRMRVSPRVALPLALLAAAAVAAVLLLAADNTQRGTGSTPGAQQPPGTTGVSLPRTAAHDYDPFGGDGEHPRDTPAVLDRDRNSTWSTEGYRGGLTKKGVGIYLDTGAGDRSIAAVRMDINTPTPGWKGEVYVANGSVPTDRAGRLEERRAHRCDAGAAPRSTSTPRATATATTSSGSPRCRRGPSACRSPSSTSSAARAERQVRAPPDVRGGHAPCRPAPARRRRRAAARRRRVRRPRARPCGRRRRRHHAAGRHARSSPTRPARTSSRPGPRASDRAVQLVDDPDTALFAKTFEPSTGIHTRVYARAIVLEQRRRALRAGPGRPRRPPLRPDPGRARQDRRDRHRRRPPAALGHPHALLDRADLAGRQQRLRAASAATPSTRGSSS